MVVKSIEIWYPHWIPKIFVEELTGLRDLRVLRLEELGDQDFKARPGTSWNDKPLGIQEFQDNHGKWCENGWKMMEHGPFMPICR